MVRPSIPANKIVHVIPGKAGGHSGGGTVTPTPTPTPPAGDGVGTANATAMASAISVVTKQSAGSALATTSALAIAASIRTGAGAASAAAAAAALGTAAKLAVGAAAAASTAQAVAPTNAVYQPTAINAPTVAGASGPGGAPIVGDVLSLTGDTWANAGGTITKSYQWFRGLVQIATTSTYTVTTADIGTNLRGVVTATNAVGDWPSFAPFTPYVRLAATATYDIAFGTKTRSGHGGFQVGIGRTITAGNSLGDWTVDDIGDLCPTGTFSAQKTFGASSYLLTLDNAQTVQITMVANRFDVTPRYGSAANNDGGAGAAQSQCNYVLSNTGAGACVLGDDIYWRNFRIFNPAALDYRFDMRSTFTGTGRIRIYGMYYAYVSTDFPSDFVTAIDFVNANGYNNVATSTFGGMLSKANPNVGSGIGVFDSTFLVGPSCNIPGDIYGIKTRGAGDCSRNSFNNCGAGIAAVHKNGEDNGDYCDNVFTLMQEDCIKGTWHGAGQKIWRNFTYNQPFYSGNHPDIAQHQGFTDGIAHAMGSMRFNVAVRNVGTTGQGDFQGIFMTATTAPASMNGLIIRQNIILQTFANGIVLDIPVNPIIDHNTSLFDYPIGDIGAGTISQIAVGVAGTGGNINNNVANNNMASNWASQTGATVVDNIQLASTSGAYAAAFNAFASTGLTTRAAALAAFTPKENGTLAKVDTSYAGALLPPSSGNGTIGCWNSGEAMNPQPTGYAAAVTTAQAVGGGARQAAGSAAAVSTAQAVSPDTFNKFATGATNVTYTNNDRTIAKNTADAATIVSSLNGRASGTDGTYVVEYAPTQVSGGDVYFGFTDGTRRFFITGAQTYGGTIGLENSIPGGSLFPGEVKDGSAKFTFVFKISSSGAVIKFWVKGSLAGWLGPSSGSPNPADPDFGPGIDVSSIGLSGTIKFFVTITKVGDGGPANYGQSAFNGPVPTSVPF